jgi:hypothetical protein
MIHRYAEWTRRQANSAQCSPALAALACVIALGIAVYVYRQVILTTIITAALAAVAVAVFVGTVIVVISTLRWYRKSRKAEPTLAMPAPDTWTRTEPATDVTAEADISAEADWLAAEGIELAFSPDGKTLKVKNTSKE